MSNKNSVRVTFWGVRGSWPVCKPGYSKVGGDTSCVSLEVDGHYLIFDAGTGIINAGQEILNRGFKRATLLMSHAHADHINGLAFFEPLHQKDFELTIIAGEVISKKKNANGIEAILSQMISPPYFPISWFKTACQKSCIDVSVGAPFSVGPLKVSTIALDHPGGSTGYRVDVGEKSICYITDTGHVPGRLNSNLVKFINQTDLMIYDATFTEEEFKDRESWGHSTWNQAVDLANKAAVREIALFHHSPHHDDIAMATIEVQVQERFPQAFVARQGMTRIL
ncbi:MAG: MBL fold metallo-hydrolase [Alphaproteobacteria bacterium]|nr:MBL fold metallo-hydrolase [Alphaproteobacteria bacterium]